MPRQFRETRDGRLVCPDCGEAFIPTVGFWAGLTRHRCPDGPEIPIENEVVA